ncbi:MAG: hypothetical protein J6I74_05335 [Schwartzia sp.]|nr:hypothetical protein [Schwartzia sp. (in: firmicutes)]
MKKWRPMLAMLLVLGIFQPTEAANKETVPETPMVSSVEIEDAAVLFERAYIAYSDGKRAGQANVRNEKYAEAINAISRATALQPDNTDVLLLASQIYRSKGGAAFAKEYFIRAESILIARIAASPKDIGANLDYAIACYAGDSRFRDNYDSYRKIAYQHADEVIRLVGRPGGGNAAQLRAMAFAYLIKGDAKHCGDLLSQAAQSDVASKFYSELFSKTVGQGQWLWPVSADGVEKEFLLYVLTDSTRYAGVSDTLKMTDSITK